MGKVKILYDNVKLLSCNSRHSDLTWMYLGNPAIPNHAWTPQTYAFPPTPSPAKPCFRPGDTLPLLNMRSTYIAVPKQRQNLPRNAPRFQHGNAAPWMSSHSRCFPGSRHAMWSLGSLCLLLPRSLDIVLDAGIGFSITITWQQRITITPQQWIQMN